MLCRVSSSGDASQRDRRAHQSEEIQPLEAEQVGVQEQAQYGGEHGEWDVAFTLEANRSDGDSDRRVSLSTPMTTSPRRAYQRATDEPINPPAPVTSTFMKVTARGSTHESAPCTREVGPETLLAGAGTRKC